MSETFKAQGLHDAMLLIPAALVVTMLALLVASRFFVADANAMRMNLRTPGERPADSSEADSSPTLQPLAAEKTHD